MNPPIVFIPNIENLYDTKNHVLGNQNVIKKLSQDLESGKQVWIKGSERWTQIYAEGWLFPQWLSKRFHTAEVGDETFDNLIKSYSEEELKSCVTLSSRNEDYKYNCGPVISPMLYFPEAYPSIDDLYKTGAQVILYYGKQLKEPLHETYIDIKNISVSRLLGRRFMIHVTDRVDYRTLIDEMIKYFPDLPFIVATDGSHPMELESYSTTIYWRQI